MNRKLTAILEALSETERSDATSWLKDQAARCKAELGDQWTKHEKWVKNYLIEELRQISGLTRIEWDET